MYLPKDIDTGKYPDKEFFWGLAFTIIPDWANKYNSEVIK